MARVTTTRRLIAAVAATGAVITGIGGLGATANAAPKMGTPCGPNKVITTIGTCAPINSSCTGYDLMLIGRVDRTGRCVIPGMNGTTW
ncbi:hypothetical protein GOARA_063_00680 [Gordonia araii NBRC 100433]|uniref:Uncharacterized protein n=1 Tax=Gordonia araii NBRC 100433 TaxID=1073574 RepID=G7H4U4_9ACTN|nr:hypothetical protein [Gordonia araii]NNG97991.1 hypothetical protein [Gordonia araii NBRC 100433]GAB10869.1 hypothetical protein GOARA_063_00680 [Gordonia araii NBRC 100433]